MTAEVPVWVFGRCRWVSGVCRRTTCHDVLEAVLSAPGPGAPAPEADPGPAPDANPNFDPTSYVIVERWKGVERRLDGRVRILKVWSAWGEAQSDVQLLVRRVSEKGASRHRPGTATGSRRHRKRVKPAVDQHGHPEQQQSHHEVHRLMRLILAQGETIAGQLRRLRDREAQIERLEAETHRERVARHGKDYLLAAYLKEGEEGEGGAEKQQQGLDDVPAETPRTSRTAEQPGRPGCGKPRQLCLLEEDPANLADESDAEVDVGAAIPGGGPGGGGGCDRYQQVSEAADRDELRARIALWEKVVKVNKRLEQQEERLVRLYVGFRRSAPDEAAVDDRKELRSALTRLQQDIDEGRRDLQANAELLTETEALLDVKRRFLRRLHLEIEAAEVDTQRLMSVNETPTPPSTTLPLQRKAAPCLTTCGTQAVGQSSLKGHNNDNDSNSDTGLSSLHSSSEEGVYILDTLV